MWGTKWYCNLWSPNHRIELNEWTYPSPQLFIFSVAAFETYSIPLKYDIPVINCIHCAGKSITAWKRSPVFWARVSFCMHLPIIIMYHESCHYKLHMKTCGFLALCVRIIWFSIILYSFIHFVTSYRIFFFLKTGFSQCISITFTSSAALGS